MRTLVVGILILVGIGSSALAGGAAPGNGNRLILATYWGDDRVALIDLYGDPGKEEIWTLDTLKAVGCSKPYDIRSNSRGDEAYTSCSGTDQVAVIDIVAQQIKYTIRTGSSPRDLQLFDDGKKLIVANSGSDTVSVVDLARRTKLYDVSVSYQPYGVAVTNNGQNALVTGWASGDLHFLTLGPTSGQDVGKVPVGLLPYTVVAPGNGKIAYVAANGSHRVFAIDVANKKIQSTIQVGRNPWSLAASPDGQYILVTNNRSNNLSLLRTGFAAPQNATTVGAPAQIFISAGSQRQPNGQQIARAAKNASISQDGKTAVFTDLANNQIAVVDLGSNQITKVINVGKAPYGIEFVR